MSHTENKPCIVCEPPTARRTTQKVVELAQLCLRFGRVDRVTYHEDGKRSETDTDHTVMLAVVACAFASDHNHAALDVGLVAQFALVHDLVEAYAGDTNTLATDGSTHTKEAREAAALGRIRSEFAAAFPWLTDTIDAYESLASPEARFVKALDKVLPKITHLLNGGATLRRHGVDASNIDAINGSQVAKMRVTYAADQPAVMALYADVHAMLRDALTKKDRLVPHGFKSTPPEGAAVVTWGTSAAACAALLRENAALRECVTYARVKRGKDFDFDTWENLCNHAMAGGQAASALENEIALHAQTRDALVAVRRERDELRAALARQTTRKPAVCPRCDGEKKIVSDEPCMQMSLVPCPSCTNEDAHAESLRICDELLRS